MLNAWRTIALAVLLQALVGTGYAQAQTTQPQMPMMGWEMSWPMIIGCVLLAIVLVLAAAALIKYLVFR